MCMCISMYMYITSILLFSRYFVGEYGYHTEDNTPKDTKSNRGSKTEEELNLLASQHDDNDECFSVTKALKPIDHSQRYCIMRWEEKKPCLNLKFPMGDERTRHFYQSVILRQYCRLVSLIIWYCDHVIICSCDLGQFLL